ncbi:MAG TPA: BON domain-containing protein [Acidimicrobiales bacterium]|nr:BON domain-containing protein [Acidimicrobiales bacterium]
MLMKLGFKLLKIRVGCLAVGAGAMYLLDPDRGRSRRADMQSRAAGAVRRQFRTAARRTEAQERNLMHRLEGAMAEARGGGRFRPESEVDLREHLRQVIHGLDHPGRGVNVDVHDGTVTLRGEVDSDERRRQIIDAVRPVDGVERIEDYTHLPGEVAPNKASVIGLR